MIGNYLMGRFQAPMLDLSVVVWRGTMLYDYSRQKLWPELPIPRLKK